MPRHSSHSHGPGEVDAQSGAGDLHVFCGAPLNGQDVADQWKGPTVISDQEFTPKTTKATSGDSAWAWSMTVDTCVGSDPSFQGTSSPTFMSEVPTWKLTLEGVLDEKDRCDDRRWRHT